MTMARLSPCDDTSDGDIWRAEPVSYRPERWRRMKPFDTFASCGRSPYTKALRTH